MKIKTTTNIEQIVAKIDNDFNPEGTDWIPRIVTWTIEVLDYLKINKTKHTVKKYIVNNKIAIIDCKICNVPFKVYDRNKCIIEALDSKSCCNLPFKGQDSEDNIAISNTITVTNVSNNAPNKEIYQQVNNSYDNPRYNVYEYREGINPIDKNYVLIGDNKIELNFETDYIYLEFDEVETYYSNKFNCELPVIPNNAILHEAIVAYCMYKMLCRGYKHPIFNLRDNSPALNPYINWTMLLEKAKISVMADEQDRNSEDAAHLMRSNFYINTFDPRH